MDGGNAMKTLERVTRESVGGRTMLYLSYQIGARVARTIEVAESGSVTIDVDAEGETIGIELLAPGVVQLEILTHIARERDLSLDGLFTYA